MNTSRTTARVVGILLITGTVAGILSLVVTSPILDSPDYLRSAAHSPASMVTGALLVLLMGFSLAMVPILLFPLFKRYDEVLAIGAVVFRGCLEPVAYLSLAISWLLLLTLGHDYTNTDTYNLTAIKLLGALLLDTGNIIGQILAIVFSLGALMIYCLFYRSKLIPRWLSVWGLIGAMLYFSEPILALYNFQLEALFAPLALQEVVLAFWLIICGFNEPEQAETE